MLLDIKKIRFKNFFSFGAKYQELELKEGLNLVIGYDKDSDRRNAAGKSSLIDAIVFGLFGKTAKDVTLPRIPNWKNKRNCEVVIEFEKNNVAYRIERGLKPGYIRLYKNDVEVEQVSHKSDFQEEIEKDHLGIDFDTFMSLIHCNPNTSISIFNISKGQKRNFIEKLFGLETFSSIAKKANEKLASIDHRITAIASTIEFNKKSISALEQQNAEFETSSRRLISFRKEIRELENKIEHNLEKEKELNEALNVSKTQLKDKETHLSKIKNLVVQVDKKKALLYQKIKMNSTFENNAKEEKELLKKLQTLQAIEPINQNDSLPSELAAAESSLLNCKLELQKYTTLLSTLPDVSKLKDSCECPTCLSIVDYATIASKHESKKKEYDNEIIQINANLICITELIKDIKNKQKAFEDYQKVTVSIETITKQLENISSNRSKAKKNDLYNKIYEKNYSKLIKTLDANLTKLQKEYSKLEDKIKIIGESLSEIKVYTVKYAMLKEKEIEQQKQKEIFASYIEANEVKIQDFKKEISNVEKEKKQLTVMEDYLEYIKTICKDENVKQFAIANIIPYVNQQVNSYLAEAGFNFYIKLDSWLDIEIKGPGIDNSSYGNLSGGESKSVDLALQLAFLDVCKLHSAVFPNILLLDEILDSAIDSQGIQLMMSIIKHKQQTDDLKVYIISHRKEINEIESDRIYQVTKSKGFSTINEVA